MSGSPTAAAPRRRCWPCARAASRARASGSASAPGNGATGRPGSSARLAHERPHDGLAVERFFPDGPFARLPMTGDRCSIVWALDDSLSARPCWRWTTPGSWARWRSASATTWASWRSPARAGPIPLALVLADRYTAHRAGAGRRRRARHPPDRRARAGTWPCATSRRWPRSWSTGCGSGLDPGDAAGAGALRRLAAVRRHGAGRRSPTASTGCSPTTFCRCAWRARPGLPPVEQVPPLKRYFMQHAMGLVGDLPRAMRGRGRCDSKKTARPRGGRAKSSGRNGDGERVRRRSRRAGPGRGPRARCRGRRAGR